MVAGAVSAHAGAVLGQEAAAVGVQAASRAVDDCDRPLGAHRAGVEALEGGADRQVVASIAVEVARCQGIPEEITALAAVAQDRKSTRLNSSHANISYAV